MSASQSLIQGSKLPVKLLPADQSAVQNQSTKIYPGFYSTRKTFGQDGAGWNPNYGQNKISPINPVGI